MNSLSRQALTYLSESEKGDKLAQNKLCCLILLLDKEYKSKIVQLDEVLLFHILNHLADCCIESFKEYGKIDHAFEQLVRKLALADLKLGDTRIMAFNRCTYFARVIAGELKATVDDDVKFVTETVPDVEIDPEDRVEQKDQNVEKVSVKKAMDTNEDEGVPTETQFNTIPAPDLHNIKIESKIPPHKSKQFSQIYKLWNQDLNPTLKENTSV